MRYTMGEGFCGQYASVVIRLTIAVIFAKIIWALCAYMIHIRCVCIRICICVYPNIPAFPITAAEGWRFISFMKSWVSWGTRWGRFLWEGAEMYGMHGYIHFVRKWCYVGYVLTFGYAMVSLEHLFWKQFFGWDEVFFFAGRLLHGMKHIVAAPIMVTASLKSFWACSCRLVTYPCILEAFLQADLVLVTWWLRKFNLYHASYWIINPATKGGSAVGGER